MRLPLPPIMAALAITVTLLTRNLLAGPSQPLAGLVGLALGVVGLALILPAARRFQRAGTTVNPARPELASVLVTTGLNAHSRNPMYIGEVLVVLAVAVSVNPGVGLPAALAFFMFLDRWQIPAEERALRGRFGAAFDAYAARVRRWL